MDDDLRNQANECIQRKFPSVLETREFYSLPTIKLELISETRIFILNFHTMIEKKFRFNDVERQIDM